MATTTPYLDAIQKIPGNIPGEKFRSIANFIRETLSVSDNLEEIIKRNKFPTILVPLVHIQAAVVLNKKNPKNQNACMAITEALKSSDKNIVNQALRANRFFDGTNKSITNLQYFIKHIFPYVSLNTRIRIIKTLAFQLSSKKNSDLAEEFFLGVESLYGINQALPLLLACNDSFTYDTIVEKRIVLSRQLVKQIFCKNPDLIVRYFKLSKPNLDPLSRNLHPVNIYDFSNILTQLIRKRLNSFVELCEIYEKIPSTVTLKSKMAQVFLKNGRKYLYEKPQLYIRMLPLKKISNECMEAIYPKLFPENIKDFNTDDMLKYLLYYPEDKQADLFLKSYQQMYGKNILDEPKKVTVKLLKILPTEERTTQAKIKLENESNYTDFSCNEVYQVNCVNCWDCYLPVDILLPRLKEEISKESEMKSRTFIACKMIYCCYVNKNGPALLEILTYLRNRHTNEQPWFTLQVFHTLLNLYDLPSLGNEYWLVLEKMISSAHMRKTLAADVKISVSMIEAAIHHNILQTKDIVSLVDILVDLKSLRKSGHWNILQKYPQHEETCLKACITVVSQKYDSNQTPWMEDRVGILYDLCVSIYQFNKIHVNKCSRIKPITITDYPWLSTTVENILTLEQSNSYMCQNFRNLLMRNDMKLYDRLWPKDKRAQILTGQVFKILKKDPKEILTEWKDYLHTCTNHWHKYHTRIFVKALRWYNDIPIQFAKQCLQDLSESDGVMCLNVLAALVHGKTFSKIVEPLIPTIDVEHQEVTVNYGLVQRITSSIRLANPPVSETVLSKLCNLDSLSTLPAITNDCRRINAADVISFTEMLCTRKVSIQKHGIRLTNLVASREYMLNFLRVQWNSKEHHSIRQILLFLIMKLFAMEPGPATWSLFFETISTLTVEYSKMLSKLIPMIASTPDEYVADYIKQLLDTIDTFEKASLNSEQIAEYTSNLLGCINAAICNLLPDDFIKDLLRKYLFHQDLKISESSSTFIITALLLPQDKFDNRMELFCNVFKEIVTSGWNVPHPKYPRFYPVNNALRRFVEAILGMFPDMKMESRLIDKLLSTFVSVLEPHMEPTSYLLLVYCNEKVNSTTPKEFGSKLGKKIDDLIEIFSPFFMFFMADVLLQMPLLYLFDGYDKDDVDFAMIEGLLEVGTIPATLLATKLFKFVKPNEQPERYDELMKKFLECDSPVVKSSLCDIVNNSRYMD